MCGLQFVTVHPRISTLRPGQSSMCVVKFYALGQPAFYDIDLVCEVRSQNLTMIMLCVLISAVFVNDTVASRRVINKRPAYAQFTLPTRTDKTCHQTT